MNIGGKIITILSTLAVVALVVFVYVKFFFVYSQGVNEGDIMRGQMADLDQLYICGNMVTKNLDRVSFDENGVCTACNHYEARKNIDWDARWKEFEALCDKYRGCNGPGQYDCAIAASGGKDSHFQVYIMKEVMKMNPILFSVEDNFPMTEAGKHNLKNISEAFGCPIISCKPDIRTQKILMKNMFEKYGKPTWYLDRHIYTFPLHMALKFNTMLLVYGENVSYEYGGNEDEETYSARSQIENGVASGMDEEELMMTALDAGAEDFEAEDGTCEILTDPDNFSEVYAALEAAGITIASGEVTMIPQTWAESDDPAIATSMEKMIDMLEDDDDVQNVYHNWEE